MIKAGVIGLGCIGKELVRQITARHWHVSFAADSRYIYRIHERFTDDELVKRAVAPISSYEQFLPGINVLFLAIPSDQGEQALHYAYAALKKGIPVITCEKGLLSEYFSDIRFWFEKNRIGYSATVGGGTMMLPEMQKRLIMHSSPPAIYSVLNSTLNFLLSGGTVAHAMKLGLLEPGAIGPTAIINAEIADTVRKAIIIHNSVLNSAQPIRTKEIKVTPVTPPAYYRLITGGFRYYVVFSPERQPKIVEGRNNYICFCESIGNGSIVGGFFKPEKNEFFQKLAIPGENNAFILDSPYEEYREIFPAPQGGPGAGPTPTATAMLKDAEYILAERGWGCLVSYLP